MIVIPAAFVAGTALVLVTGECTPTPPDIERFVAERELCDHFRQEEPFSEERKIFIERALEKNCRGTDAWLAALKQKYGNCPALNERLNLYDPDTEPHG